MEITRSDLVQYIQNIKKTLGWTYEEMAEKTGIDRFVLADYGLGRHFPRNQKKTLEIVNRIRKAAAEEQRRRRASRQ